LILKFFEWIIKKIHYHVEHNSVSKGRRGRRWRYAYVEKEVGKEEEFEVRAEMGKML